MILSVADFTGQAAPGSIAIIFTLIISVLTIRSLLTNEWRQRADLKEKEVTELRIEQAKATAQIAELSKRPDMTKLAGMIDSTMQSVEKVAGSIESVAHSLEHHTEVMLGKAETFDQKTDLVLEQARLTMAALQAIEQKLAS